MDLCHLPTKGSQTPTFTFKFQSFEICSRQKSGSCLLSTCCIPAVRQAQRPIADKANMPSALTELILMVKSSSCHGHPVLLSPRESSRSCTLVQVCSSQCLNPKEPVLQVASVSVSSESGAHSHVICWKESCHVPLCTC